MAESRRFDLAIVGAGIAGSALAASLAGRGLRLALLEAADLAPSSLPPAAGLSSFDSRVSALTPQSRRLLESIGSWQAIMDYRACPYRHMTVWDAEGTGCIEFDAAEVKLPELGHIVENRVVVDALLEKLRGSQGITLLSPARLVACERCDEGQLQLSLADGGELLADLVVAADGALSPLREMFGFRTREWNYGHRALVCTVQTERPHRETAWQRFLASGPLAFLPLSSYGEEHYCSIVWSLEEELADGILALDDSAFCTALGEAFEHRLGRVIAASPRGSFSLRQRHAVDYVQPGVALIADAAHTIHPLAGQGINLGLQDVGVLAEEVMYARERGLQPGRLEVLRRYQRRRKGENLLMMAAMDGFKRLFEQDALPLRWLRNEGMGLVSRSGPLKQQLMRHAMGLR